MKRPMTLERYVNIWYECGEDPYSGPVIDALTALVNEVYGGDESKAHHEALAEIDAHSHRRERDWDTPSLRDLTD
jgi:hypothetical protein